MKKERQSVCFGAASIILQNQNQTFLKDGSFIYFKIKVLCFCCAGSHVHQNSTGCEWDAKSCKVKDCNQYDEEDFIPLDLRTTMTRTTPKTQTAVVKDLWNVEKTRLEHIKTIYASSLEYLKYYMDYGISFLQRRGSDNNACWFINAVHEKTEILHLLL